MAGFTYRKRLSGPTADATILEIPGANNVVVQKGDLIRVDTDGFGALLTAGDLVLGVVVGVVDQNGVSVDPDATTIDTYTMPAANETAATQTRIIQYIPAFADYLFYNLADSALARNLLFTYMAVNDENDVDPGSTSDTTVNTVRLIEIDPDGDGDTAKGLFQIVESFWAQNGMGTVDTGGIEA